MSRCWSAYEGLSVGVWKLESFLGERDEIAFFTAKDARREASALVTMVDASAPGASARAASWREAARLSHPALLAVHDLGEAELDGAAVAYAALDLPHDDLSEAVTRRVLTADEARSTFAPVARALEYLHARGLRHNAVRPENIFLVGDTVKLGIDSLTPAHGGAESDLRQFGGTLAYAMTGVDVQFCKSDIAAGLPPPFNEIAAGCLNEASNPNWNARRIADVLGGRSDTLPPGQPGASEAESRPMRRRFSPVIIGAIAIGVIAAYLFSGRHSQPPAAQRARTQPSPPATTPTLQVEKPNPARVAAQGARGAPPVYREASPPVETAEADRLMDRPAAARASEPAGPKGSWAVIAATYSSFGAAAKRADALRKLSPQLRPHVFPREGQGRRYYVVLGSSLTQNAAQRLRALATSLGAPKDTYVTKLDES